MFWCGFLFILFQSIETKQCNLDSLQLVSVLFRHGDRTTDVSTLYPKDPYINVTYAPYGRGELTKKGQATEYRLGQSLRGRYGSFLGPEYRPDLLDALTSPYNRSSASLQLVLAGLFPPTPEEMFEVGLNWQPIPLYNFPKPTDTFFLGIDNCRNFNKYVDRYLQTKQNELKIYQNVFNYISNNTGLEIRNYIDLLLVYTGLKTELEWGLVLPKWTKRVYPEILKKFALKSFELMTATTPLRKISSGYLLKKFVDDAVGKASGQLVPVNRKLFLYSGHEFNIASILHTLNIFDDELPAYGSYIMLELHKIKERYGIKIYYQNYSELEPKLMKLPACDEFCPLDQFIGLVEEYFPDPNVCGNEAIKSNCSPQ